MKRLVLRFLNELREKTTSTFEVRWDHFKISSTLHFSSSLELKRALQASFTMLRRICFQPYSHLSRLRHGRMFSTALVTVVRRDGEGFVEVRMNRAPVNSLNGELIQELTNTISMLEEDQNVDGMILASEQKVFSAGIDITEMLNVPEEQFRKFWTSFEGLWKTLYMTPLATVAAMESHAPAGGLVLALACDWRVMSENEKLKLGLNETQLGMVAPRWLRAMCARTVGERAAEHLLQQGKMLGPKEAFSVGFVDELAATDQVMTRSREIISAMLKIPPKARALTKREQRLYTAEMTGYDSTNEMWEVVSSPECAKMMEITMAKLKKK